MGLDMGSDDNRKTPVGMPEGEMTAKIERRSMGGPSDGP